MKELQKAMLAVELLEVLAEFRGQILTEETPDRVKDVLTSWIGHRFPMVIDVTTIKVTASESSLWVDIPELRGVLAQDQGHSSATPSAPHGGGESGNGSGGVSSDV